MKKLLFAVALAGMVSGCATVSLSEPISESIDIGEKETLRIGFVADSQLQTRRNYNLVPGYRGRFEERFTSVSIRPPALDWAARSMLQLDLEALAEQGAKAVFYLGDGANNGCYDELLLGYDDSHAPAFNDRGLLKILDDFRRAKGIPVFFVIGNHDILGAGSTSRPARRELFCEDKTAEIQQIRADLGIGDGTGSGGAGNPENRWLGKPEIMAKIDKFNRGNADIDPLWKYNSNIPSQPVEKNCGKDPVKHHRTWGCYIAATVDYEEYGKDLQFLLVDTTDFVSVTKSELFNFDQEGARGAMSYGTSSENSTPSQTSWFDENASDFVSMRVALTHYNIGALRKSLGIGPVLSSKTQRFADLFLRNVNPIEFIQSRAYVVSAHSHTKEPYPDTTSIKLNCWMSVCRDGIVEFGELNVGSTTDYSNYATLVHIDPATNSLGYSKVGTTDEDCAEFDAAVAAYDFGRPLKEEQVGWKAIGVDGVNYQNYDLKDLVVIWDNIERYAGDDLLKATCIGRHSAKVEAGKDRPVDAQ